MKKLFIISIPERCAYCNILMMVKIGLYVFFFPQPIFYFTEETWLLLSLPAQRRGWDTLLQRRSQTSRSPAFAVRQHLEEFQDLIKKIKYFILKKIKNPLWGLRTLTITHKSKIIHCQWKGPSNWFMRTFSA